ncbi:unnamed protein product [Pleuronectes platessa]|uniref:Uncharacterized protein n=1 Tax=Pleuronectes platessa TaxID=8262 RepID=A0A9N7UW26_PLEPL|nr:unnamed protein product [Pleuronectes platessa]
MEEVQALMEQLQQLKTANEQLREQLQNQSQLAEPLPGSSTSSPNVVPEGSLASDAVNLRYVYVPRERKCPKFTGKMSLDLLTLEQWIEEGQVDIPVVNVGTEDVWLQPHTQLGELHVVDLPKSKSSILIREIDN